MRAQVAVLLVLASLVSFMPGCEVLLFYYLLDQDEENWDTVGEVTCGPDGARADGKLVIPILTALDEQEAEDTCSWWNLDFQNDSYQACCGGDCCEWGVGIFTTDSTTLAGDGEWCRWSGMCQEGLTCFPPDAGTPACPEGEAVGPDGCVPEASAVESGVCRLSRLNEWCDDAHDCEDPMFCSAAWGQGECRLHVAAEGEGCLPSDVEQCLLPMKCTCPTVNDCRCWDGSKGDPCEEGSCVAGLRCLEALVNGTLKPRCVVGAAGDPCQEGTCLNGLTCMPMVVEGYPDELYRCVEGVLGDPCFSDVGCDPELQCLKGDSIPVGHCGRWLVAKEPCTPGSVTEVCASFLVCNSALPTPVCSIPGLPGDPCNVDIECGEGLHCSAKLNKCTGGLPGDYCGATEDCLAGAVCMFADGAMHCYAYAGPGDSCAPENPYLKCIPGLVCTGAGGDFVCVAPGKDKAPCTSDVDCTAGYRCVGQILKCFDGRDGDPCYDASDCAEGWKCLDGVGQCYDNGSWFACGKCYNGNTWDGCSKDEDCAPGYLCDPEKKACFAQGHGKSCSVTADCAEGLICIPVDMEGACFEYLDQGDLCGPTAPPFSACDKGLVCNDAVETPACALPGEEGTACTTPKHCAEGLICSGMDSTCHDGGEGDPCAGVGDCGGGFLCSSADSQCHDGGEGDPCTTETECASGICLEEGLCA